MWYIQSGFVALSYQFLGFGTLTELLLDSASISQNFSQDNNN